MSRLFRVHLNFANVSAGVALLVALGTAATVVPNPVQAANTVAGTWFLAGTFSDLAACTSCEVSLAPSGDSSFGSVNNSSNQLLSPNVPVVASHLSVHLETAPGSGTRKFFLTSHTDISHSLTCSITGTSTTCNSGSQTLKVAPGTRLYVDAANIGNAAASKLQLSWLATP